MPIYSQIYQLISEKIFKVFLLLLLPWQPEFSWVYFIWAILIEDHPTIIYVKFY